MDGWVDNELYCSHTIFLFVLIIYSTIICVFHICETLAIIDETKNKDGKWDWIDLELKKAKYAYSIKIYININFF